MRFSSYDTTNPDVERFATQDTLIPFVGVSRHLPTIKIYQIQYTPTRITQGWLIAAAMFCCLLLLWATCLEWADFSVCNLCIVFSIVFGISVTTCLFLFFKNAKRRILKSRFYRFLYDPLYIFVQLGTLCSTSSIITDKMDDTLSLEILTYSERMNESRVSFLVSCIYLFHALSNLSSWLYHTVKIVAEIIVANLFIFVVIITFSTIPEFTNIAPLIKMIAYSYMIVCCFLLIYAINKHHNNIHKMIDKLKYIPYEYHIGVASENFEGTKLSGMLKFRLDEIDKTAMVLIIAQVGMGLVAAIIGIN